MEDAEGAVVGLRPDEAAAMTPEGGYFQRWMEALEEMDQALPARARIPSFRETPHQLDDDIIDQGRGSEAQPTDFGS
jgi:hypothetical protein